MILSEYIKKLQELEAKHGGDIPVLEYIDEYDGTGDCFTSADEPELLEQDDWYIDDFSDVPDNGWHGLNSKDIRKSRHKIKFAKAIIVA